MTGLPLENLADLGSPASNLPSNKHARYQNKNAEHLPSNIIMGTKSVLKSQSDSTHGGHTHPPTEPQSHGNHKIQSLRPASLCNTSVLAAERAELRVTALAMRRTRRGKEQAEEMSGGYFHRHESQNWLPRIVGMVQMAIRNRLSKNSHGR
eukprot:COSAG01_NODE_1172_length_11400_cov_12.759579_15_plen_151_part_00